MLFLHDYEPPISKFNADSFRVGPESKKIYFKRPKLSEPRRSQLSSRVAR